MLPSPGTLDPLALRESEQRPIHWAKFIDTHCAERRAFLGRQLRTLLLVTGYTGTNASGEVMHELGVHHEDLVASDPKPAARRFREQNGLEASCSFDNIRDLNEAGMGWCWRCLSARCRLSSIPPDLAVLGFPCRQFSAMRTGSSNLDDVERHPDFDLVSHARRFVTKTRPLG